MERRYFLSFFSGWWRHVFPSQPGNNVVSLNISNSPHEAHLPPPLVSPLSGLALRPRQARAAAESDGYPSGRTIRQLFWLANLAMWFGIVFLVRSLGF